MASYRLEFNAEGSPRLVENDDPDADHRPLGEIIAGKPDPESGIGREAGDESNNKE